MKQAVLLVANVPGIQGLVMERHQIVQCILMKLVAKIVAVLGQGPVIPLTNQVFIRILLFLPAA